MFLSLTGLHTKIFFRLVLSDPNFLGPLKSINDNAIHRNKFFLKITFVQMAFES